MNDIIGITGLFNIIVTLLSIGLTWWCIQIVNFDVLLKNARGGHAKVFQIIISIVIGYTLAKFVIDYYQWSTMLKWLL